jgi:hypothetical protein
MRHRFVPSYYARDLLNKLQHLKQGTHIVEEYYQELQTGMLRYGLVENNDAAMARFVGGLNREIQDVLDYKDTLILLAYSILLVKLNVKCRDDMRGHKLTLLQVTPRRSTQALSLLLCHPQQRHHHLAALRMTRQ